MRKKPTNLFGEIDNMFGGIVEFLEKKRTGKEKRLFLIVGAVVGMFLVYNLFLSPYAQCVSGYVKHHDWELGTKTKSEIKARGKIRCKALGR